MDISSLLLSLPFPKLKIDNNQSEYEIFSTNFRAVNHESLTESIENLNELIKSKNLAGTIRFIGNEHFSKSNHKLALLSYHKSISLAPIDSREYALAFANRSAVFFALNKYKECLLDIEHVLKSNYPADMLFKIYIRQTECYLNLKQNKDALRAWINATIYADKFKYNKNSEKIDSIKNKIMAITQTAQVCNKDIQDVIYPRPDFKNGENLKFLNASNSVELKCNNAKGRHVVAKVDIEPGDILFVEEPYSAVPIYDSDVNCTFCSNCFIFSACSIPCKTCAVEFYCSTICRESAWENAHKWECYGIRKELLNCDMRLILKTLFEASRNNFDTVVEDESRYGNKRNNFAFVHKLLTNKSKMTNDDMCLFTKYSILLVIYLKQFTNYFTWLHDQPMYAEKTMSELFDFVGGIILKITLQNYSNYDEIMDIDLFFYNDTPDIEYNPIGCGLYVSSAMINHSCEPNTLVSFDKSLKIVRAMKKIEKDSEITIDYMKNRCIIEGIKSSHFAFKCNCTKCTRSGGPKDETNAWLCTKCRGKAFTVNNESYAQCFNPKCRHVFTLSNYKAQEIVVGLTLVGAGLNSNSENVERVFINMKKIYHKENVKFVAYFLTAYELFYEKGKNDPEGNVEVEKCLEVSKCFVKFAEQFDGIVDFKIQAYLRLTLSLALHCVTMKEKRVPLKNTFWNEFRSSLNETKRLLTYYVPPEVIAKYEKNIYTFLDYINCFHFNNSDKL